MASAGVGAEVLRLDILFATIFYRCRQIKVKINYLNGRWRVDQGPAPQGPGRDEDPPGTPREPGDSQPCGDGGWQLLPGVPGQWRPLPPGADWMPGRAARRWPGSPATRPGTTTPTPGRPMMRSSARCAPGTASRRTPRRVSTPRSPS